MIHRWALSRGRGNRWPLSIILGLPQPPSLPVELATLMVLRWWVIIRGSILFLSSRNCMFLASSDYQESLMASSAKAYSAKNARLPFLAYKGLCSKVLVMTKHSALLRSQLYPARRLLPHVAKWYESSFIWLLDDSIAFSALYLNHQ